MSFVVVFDPEDDSETVRQEYRVLFEEYKNLVDRLLSSHMSDLEISAEQFDDACRRADGLLAQKFKQMLFEQIWAANDFEIFVRFMTQRNIELQLQALEVLAQRFGQIYESFIPEGQNKEDLLNEELVVSEALKRSLAEEGGQGEEELSPREVQSLEKSLVLKRERGEEKLQIAIQLALSEGQGMEQTGDQKGEIEVKKSLEEKCEMKGEKKGEQKRENKREVKEEVKELISGQIKGEVINVQKEEKERGKTAVKEREDINCEDIVKRSEYLRQQRDKLIQIKKTERNKQMSKLEAQEIKGGRPKSARVMRSVQQEDHMEGEGDQSLAFRRSLAARLKAEVIGLFEK